MAMANDLSSLQYTLIGATVKIAQLYPDERFRDGWYPSIYLSLLQKQEMATSSQAAISIHKVACCDDSEETPDLKHTLRAGLLKIQGSHPTWPWLLAFNRCTRRCWDKVLEYPQNIIPGSPAHRAILASERPFGGPNIILPSESKLSKPRSSK